jgi:competence protein ComEC
VSRFREPLVLPVCAFATGITAAHLGSVEPSHLPYALGLSLLVWMVGAIRRYKTTLLSALAAFAVAGALWYEVRRPGPPPELDAGAGETVLLSGCIVDAPQNEHVLQRFTLELEPGARVRVTLAIRDNEEPLPLQYGRMAEVEAKVRTPRNFRNPGSFDYAGYLAQRQIFWLASARGTASVQLGESTCGSAIGRLLGSIRSWALRRLEATYGEDPSTTALLAALLIGDDARVQKGWTEAFRITGTYHALVISGLHITVVAGVLFAMLRLAATPLVPALLISAGAAWLYAGVANWEAPAVRSAAGFSLFLLARLFYRRGRLLNVVAATALVFLIVDPASLFSPSFQLSFLAVAGVAALAVPAWEATLAPYRSALHGLANAAQDLRHSPGPAQFRIELRLLSETLALALRMPLAVSVRFHAAIMDAVFYILELGMVTLLVQLALAVPSISYFHRLPITGILANLIVPVALTVAVPFGLLGLLTDLPAFSYPARLLLVLSRHVADVFASWEPLWRIPSPPLLWSMCFCFTLVLLAVAFRKRQKVQVITMMSLAAGALLVAQPFNPPAAQGSLSVSTLDVGQGDSIFVTLPDGRLMLVDGGGLPVFNPKAPPQLDIGEDVVSPYLWHLGLRRLNIVALSHLHDDHARGMPAILRNFRPQELWVGAAPESDTWNEIRMQASQVGTRIRFLRAGDRVAFGAATVHVLAPSREYTPGVKPHNDDSLVLHLNMGRHNFLLTGDLEQSGEVLLASAAVIPDIDVLKVGHHGSKTSTTDELLDAARPRFALISSGAGNLYGHPNPAVLARLWHLGTHIYRTDLQGMVSVTSNGRHLRISTAKELESSQPAVFSKLP